MSSVNFSSCAVYFILLTIIYVTLAIGESSGLQNDYMNETSTWTSGRTKRQKPTEVPDSFRLKVKYETDDEMNLFFKRADSNLANANLPVITPFGDFTLNLMDDVGDFITYHDTKSCAAVVYFKKLNALFGVIGMSYYIDGLPFNLNSNRKRILGTVTESYVKKHEYLYSHVEPSLYIPPPSDTEAWENYFQQHQSTENEPDQFNSCERVPSAKRRRVETNSYESTSGEGTNINSDTDSNVGAQRERRENPTIQNYYLEIAVYVGRDVVKLFKESSSVGNHNERIVRHLITYFNAIDMMFQNVGNFRKRMFINIARIVIEDELVPFHFLRSDDLQVVEVVTKVPEYLRDNRLYNRPDSFDHVFVYTSRPIYDGQFSLNGYTKNAQDLYSARGNRRHFEAVPITIVKYQPNFADYGTAIHEIGRALNIKLDPQDKGLSWTGQCYGVMQQNGVKCNNCFKWSSESKRHFNRIFSVSRNRCFLMNKPRSLERLGVMPLISLYEQCTCFGFQYYIPSVAANSVELISPNECNVPIHCGLARESRLFHQSTVRPFDGTPCGVQKVCWDKKCVRNIPDQLPSIGDWGTDGGSVNFFSVIA